MESKGHPRSCRHHPASDEVSQRGVARTDARLNKLAYTLLAAAIVCAIIVVASTGFRNVPLSVATYAVAAAVSVLPASLVTVVSLVLARASTDLAKRNALVRRMDAIEALAGVENVCSDKVGPRAKDIADE